jgi:large subunit ribosomal protein L29
MKENAEKARALDTAELAKALRESEEQVFRLRFQLSIGQTDGLKKLRLLRRERARMLTVQRERELHIEAAPKTTAASAPAQSKKAPKSKPAAKSVKKDAPVKKDARPKVQGKAKTEGKPKAAAAGKTAAKKTAVRRSAKG